MLLDDIEGKVVAFYYKDGDVWRTRVILGDLCIIVCL